jgi:hypothetical protein
MTRAEQLIDAVRQSEFPHLDGLIHLFVGGSELHGAKVKDTDDLDIYGVYLEPPELLLGLDKQDFYVWSTAGDERRNGPDDVERVPVFAAKMGGSGGKGQPDRSPLSVLAKLFGPADAVGGNSEEPGGVLVTASGTSVSWVCRVTGSPTARNWDWEEGTAG